MVVHQRHRRSLRDYRVNVRVTLAVSPVGGYVTVGSGRHRSARPFASIGMPAATVYSVSPRLSL